MSSVNELVLEDSSIHTQHGGVVSPKCLMSRNSTKNRSITTNGTCPKRERRQRRSALRLCKLYSGTNLGKNQSEKIWTFIPIIGKIEEKAYQITPIHFSYHDNSIE